jgi:hypothetical protein
MADLSGKVNYDVEPDNGFEPLPAGEYLVQVTDSELKETKNGLGEYLQLTLQVIDGNYTNRLIFDRINIVNQNPTAQEIGQRQLAALRHAVGKPSAKDSAEFHYVPFIVRIKVRKDDVYGDSNEVTGRKAANGQSKTVSTPPATQTATQRPAPKPAMPTNTAKPAWAS